MRNPCLLRIFPLDGQLSHTDAWSLVKNSVRKNSKTILCIRIILLVGEYLRVESSALGKSQWEWRKCDVFQTRKSGNFPFLECVKCDMMSFVVYLNLSRRSPFISCHEIIIRVKKLQQIWFVKSLTPLLCLVSSP